MLVCTEEWGGGAEVFFGFFFFLPDPYVLVTSSVLHFLFIWVYICFGGGGCFLYVFLSVLVFFLKLLSCGFYPSSTVDKEGFLLPIKVKAIIFLPLFDSEII